MARWAGARALFGAALLGAAAATAAPRVQLYPSYNQALNVLVPGGVSKGGTVHYLGTFSGADGAAQCSAACLKSPQRCWSFVHIGGTPGGKTQYKIRVKRPDGHHGKQLQADDLADGFISTRYQTDDDYSRFLLEPLSAESNSTVRIRVVADKKLLGAKEAGVGEETKRTPGGLAPPPNARCSS